MASPGMKSTAVGNTDPALSHVFRDSLLLSAFLEMALNGKQI
jgi:hypothetical protein